MASKMEEADADGGDEKRSMKMVMVMEGWILELTEDDGRVMHGVMIDST